MFKFLKESKKEFEHVVRPTNKETKKYFTIVTSFIIVLTLFLYVIGTGFSAWLFALKDYINPVKMQQTQPENIQPTDLKLWSWSDWTNDLSDSTVTPTIDITASWITE